MTEDEQESTDSCDGGPTRRAAVLASLAIPLSAATSTAGALAAEPVGRTVSTLVTRAEDANAAFINGDMASWYHRAGPISSEFTLLQPFGGPASHGFDGSPGHLAEMASYFTGGRATLELAASYAASDLVVLVFVERQRAQVGGLPEQDWSLRVTQVYRRHAGAWELVHRHADPMVRWLGLHKAAALAAGS